MKHKWFNFLQIIIIVIFLLGSSNLQMVFAQDEAPVVADSETVVEEPSTEGVVEETQAPDPEVTEAPVEVTPTEVVTEEPTEFPPTEVVTEVPEETEVPVESSAIGEPTAEPTEEPAPEEVIADVVETLDEENLTLADESGEALDMASQETADAITNGDPWFTVGTVKYQFLQTGGICDAGVAYCYVGATPIQAALDYIVANTLTIDSNTLHVEAGATPYHEEVTIVDNNLFDGLVILGEPGSLTEVGADSSAPILDGTGLTTGFTIYNEGVSIIGFIIRNFATGILVDASSGAIAIHVDNNTIQNNGVGVEQTGGTGKPQLYVNYNIFTGNTVAVKNADGNNVQYIFAQNNYWGCPTGPVLYGEETTGNPADRRSGYWQWPTGVYLGTTLPTGCQLIAGASSLWDHQMGTSDWSPFKINLGPVVACPPGQVLINGVCVEPRYSLQVVKSSTATSITTAGQSVPYKFTVTNTGNMELTNVTVSDPNCTTAISGPTGDTNADGKLQITEAWEYTCSRTVTQAELDAGGNLSNTVTADSDESLPDTDTLDIPISQNPGLQVVKSSTTTSITTAGQSVPYKFTVTNIGNVTLTGVTVSDPNCTTAISGPSGDANSDSKLQTTETWEYTCSRTVTQAELDAGGNLSNTVTADSNESSPDTDTLNIPISQGPALQVVKSSTTTSITTAGQTVPYKFTVTNIGNVTLTGVTVSDPNCTTAISGPTGDTNADGMLQTTETWEYTCNRTVTQAELDAGGNLSNTVTADSNESDPDTDSLDIPISQNPGLQVVKSSTTTSITAAGQTVPYKFTVTNIGNVTLTNVTVSDPNCTTAISGPTGDSNADSMLQITETWEYTCNRTVTQAELDAGGNLSNTVTADSDESLPDTDSLDIPISQNPGLQVVKSSTTVSITAAGQIVPYKFTVTNIGNVTLTNVTVSDPNCTTAISGPTGDTNADSMLQTTETWEYTCNRTVTQAEVDAGGNLSNTVTADSDESAPDTDTLDIPVSQRPALNVVKSSTTTSITAAGQTVPYKFTVTNIGNVTLTNVTVSDPNCTTVISGPTGDANADGMLQTTETWEYTCSHTVTQIEVDAGGNLSNTVTADSDESAPDTDTLDIPVSQDPSLTVLKTITSTGPYVLGSTIVYNITATNNGNVTLTNVDITDANAVIGICTPAIPVAALAPTATIVCSASHVVTAADITAGLTYTNTAIATSGRITVDSSVGTTLDILGCMDPAALNYNPSATIDDGSCTYPVIPPPPAPPIPVTGGPGLLIPVTGGNLIVSGLGHSCMPYGDGQAICWGLNASGQLGDGTTVNRNVAGYVENLTGVLSLTAGSKHTCALTTDNEVWCWGENSYGQLGNDSTTDSSLPVLVTGLPADVLSLSAGEMFTCAQLTNNEVWCWGKNNFGQLNDGSTEYQTKPVKADLGTNLAQISGGMNSVFVGDVLGEILKWANQQSNAVQDVSNTLSISANRWSGSGCSISFDGSILCWGNDLVSSLVENGLPALEVGTGADHGCVVNDDETASCWGVNTYGELGNGSNLDSTIGVLVSNLTKVHTLGVGANHTCALVGTNNLPMCWGENKYGQLGNGTNIDSNVPVSVILP